MPRSVPALAVLLVAFLVAPGLVGADHVYSHRYLVTGRVIDADGHPVVNLSVPTGTTGFRSDGYCYGTSARTGVTDSQGAFWYCLHAHNLLPSDEVRIRVAGEELVQPADLDLRQSTFLVRTDRVNGTPRDPDAVRPYVVEGRLWEGTRAGLLDGVRVTGVALIGVNVTVRLTDADNATLDVVNATTNGFGNYGAVFALPPDAAPARVVVETPNGTRTFDADPEFLFTRGDVTWPGDGWHPSLEPLRLPDAPDGLVKFPDNPSAVQGAPGTEPLPFVGTVAFWFTLLALGGGALGIAEYLRRRRTLTEPAE